MKYIFIFIISTVFLLSSTLNDSLIKIHANIAPKLLLMDFDFEKKVIDNTIIILITHEKNDYKAAKQLQKDIEYKYPDGIKSYNLSVKTIPYSELDRYEKKVNLFYLFPTNKINIEAVVKKAKEYRAITFSYIKDDLSHNVMSSVTVGSKVKPILNLKAIEESKITLRPVLLKISEVYTLKGEI